MKIGRRETNGFGRIDLLAMIGAALLVCSYSATVSARSSKDRSILTCINNMKQLVRAWTHYAEDNSGILVAAGAYPADDVASGARPPEWTGGQWLDITGVTDVDEVDPYSGTSPISGSPLWKYIENPSVFQCPNDYGLVSHESVSDGSPVRRVRSYSMQSWMGGPAWQSSASWVTYTNMSNIVRPGPTQTLVFIEERPENINDGYFVIDMTGYNALGRPNRSSRIVDFPAINHTDTLQNAPLGQYGQRNNQCAVGFADGRAGSHEWQDLRTMPLVASSPFTSNIPSAVNSDVLWMQEHATRAQPF